MYRTNAQSRALEEAFLRANLPYRLVGAQRFYGRREVKDVIAYLRLVHNPADEVSLLRVINTPPRGIGAKTVETLLAAARASGLAPGPVSDSTRPARGRSSGRPRRRGAVGRPPPSAHCSPPGAASGRLAPPSWPCSTASSKTPATAASSTTAATKASNAGKTSSSCAAWRARVARVGRRDPPALARPGGVPGAGRPRLGSGHADRGHERPRPADAARRQGAGVPGSVHRRPRRGPPAALSFARRQRGDGRGAPPALRRHHPRPRPAVPGARLPPPQLRHRRGVRAVPLPRRSPGRPRRGHLRADAGARRL